MPKIEETVENAVKSACVDTGVSIYDVEYVKEGQDYVLRIFIDKDGGVNIEDCENFTNAVNPVLDALDPIKEAYILEVSSPGIERRLRRDEHFTASLGKEVEVKLYAPLDGKKVLQGTLTNATKDMITVVCEKNEYQIEKKRIASCKWFVKF